jgi:hypothetical protein
LVSFFLVNNLGLENYIIELKGIVVMMLTIVLIVVLVVITVSVYECNCHNYHRILWRLSTCVRIQTLAASFLMLVILS